MKFKPKGQKPGKKSPVGKEKETPIHTDKVMKDVLDDLRKNIKRTSTLSYYDNVSPSLDK